MGTAIGLTMGVVDEQLMNSRLFKAGGVGFSLSRIGRHLGVSDKTVARSLRAARLASGAK
jgi:hypothetical protein